MLTKGLDNVAGTAGNDTIIGSIDSASGGNVELNTLSSIDIRSSKRFRLSEV